MRRLLVLLLLLAGPLAAQGSPFVPLDHPLLPLAEYLIGRGDLTDPTPMIRPFRRADLVAAIDAAHLDPSTPSGRIAVQLRAAFSDRSDPNWVRVAPRVGFDAFTRARRDLLHPGGDGGARFYADVAIEGRFGNLVVVSRPAAENRLKLDPDWSGGAIQRRKSQAYRFIDGYLGAQFEHARLFFGQMDRNWGPAGALGLSIANYGYPRTDLGFSLVSRDIQFDIVAAGLDPMLRRADSSYPARMFLAHRLNVRVTHRLNLALWETGVLVASRESPEQGFTNPLVILSFPVQLGLPDDRNTMIGGDLSWRIGSSLRFEGQAMVDDRWRRRDDPNGTGESAHPGRWAISGAVNGALGARASWRTHLGIISSLAYRTIDSTQSFIDRGIGIGPNFTDQVSAGASVSLPVRDRWLVTPDVTFLAQGEGRLDAPFPGATLRDTPELLLGTTARTVRLGLAVSGATDRLQIAGSGGYYHTSNADHVLGRTRNRFEGRLRFTVGLSKQGAIR